jgi:hypothetical protein
MREFPFMDAMMRIGGWILEKIIKSRKMRINSAVGGGEIWRKVLGATGLEWLMRIGRRELRRI